MLKLNSEHQYRMEKIQADRDIAQVELSSTRNKQRRSKNSHLYCRWSLAIGLLELKRWHINLCFILFCLNIIIKALLNMFA